MFSIFFGKPRPKITPMDTIKKINETTELLQHKQAFNETKILKARRKAQSYPKTKTMDCIDGVKEKEII
jgi:hypothetical protein